MREPGVRLLRSLDLSGVEWHRHRFHVAGDGAVRDGYVWVRWSTERTMPWGVVVFGAGNF